MKKIITGEGNAATHVVYTDGEIVASISDFDSKTSSFFSRHNGVPIREIGRIGVAKDYDLMPDFFRLLYKGIFDLKAKGVKKVVFKTNRHDADSYRSIFGGTKGSAENVNHVALANIGNDPAFDNVFEEGGELFEKVGSNGLRLEVEYTTVDIDQVFELLEKRVNKAHPPGDIPPIAPPDINPPLT